MKRAEKIELGRRLFASERGHYIVSQALYIAIREMKKEEITKREISNIADMERLQELFPMYKIGIEAEKKFKKHMRKVSHDNKRTVSKRHN